MFSNSPVRQMRPSSRLFCAHVLSLSPLKLKKTEKCNVWLFPQFSSNLVKTSKFVFVRSLSFQTKVTMTKENSIADGIPMTPQQMQIHLQDHCGPLVVLREQGTTKVKCVCCEQTHEHGPETGHVETGCEEMKKWTDMTQASSLALRPAPPTAVALSRSFAGKKEEIGHTRQSSASIHFSVSP